MLYGIPMFLLETSIGQFTQEGFITCWGKLCPLVQGETTQNVLFLLACELLLNIFLLPLRNRLRTSGDEILRLFVHFNRSLGGLLPDVLLHVATPLGHLREHLEHRSCSDHLTLLFHINVFIVIRWSVLHLGLI